MHFEIIYNCLLCGLGLAVLPIVLLAPKTWQVHLATMVMKEWMPLAMACHRQWSAIVENNDSVQIIIRAPRVLSQLESSYG